MHAAVMVRIGAAEENVVFWMHLERCKPTHAELCAYPQINRVDGLTKSQCYESTCGVAVNGQLFFFISKQTLLVTQQAVSDTLTCRVPLAHSSITSSISDARAFQDALMFEQISSGTENAEKFPRSTTPSTQSSSRQDVGLMVPLATV